MKKISLAVIAAILILSAAFAGYQAYLSRGYTRWMSLSELNAFMKTFEAKHPGEPNYWDKGHWIDAVDAKWSEGAPHYRIRYGDAPKGQGYWWYWFINQDQNSFAEKMRKYADDGFLLAHSSACPWPDGTVHYQGVWHKYAGKKP